MTDFTVFRGEDRQVNITVEREDGGALDISDATLTFEVFANQYSDSPTLTKTSTSGNVDGVVSFDLTDSETDIEPGTYRWTLLVEEDDGTTYEAENGRLNLERTP